MKLPVPFIQLPLRFDAEVLAREISALGEQPWRDHPQKFAGNSMLPLLATEGDPANESFAGPMRPTPELLRCPYVLQVMASLGATLGRTRLMRLGGQAEVTLHVDSDYYWTDRVRVHVPIVTQPTVRFECGGTSINMAAGECWIFDTWRPHRVHNDADLSRIHLVVDTVGGDQFWELVGRGRTIGVQPHEWSPRMIAPEAGMQTTPARFEHHAIPKVMSPWELRHHLLGLLEDADQSSPLAHHASLLSESFFRSWRSLWVQFADSGEGLQDYRQCLDRFLEGMPRPIAQLPLRNGTLWGNGVVSLVGRMALRRPV